MSLVASVIVPGTTANLGPGFDCLGAALSLYNQFSFTLRDEPKAPPLTIRALGSQADQVSTTPDNLVYQAFVACCRHLKQQVPPVEITIRLGIPLARGLGSSATAIVGGLVGANLLAGSPLATSELLELAITLEGHPDNVVPALLGGCQLAASQVVKGQKTWQVCEVPWHNTIIPVVAVPHFTLATAQARAVLPLEVSRADAIFNLARLGLLLRGLDSGDRPWLAAALEDKLHQPYRQVLIPGYAAVREAAIGAGAYGAVISGAGPTLLALTNSVQAEAVAAAMVDAWDAAGIQAQARVLYLDRNGVRSSREQRA